DNADSTSGSHDTSTDDSTSGSHNSTSYTCNRPTTAWFGKRLFAGTRTSVAVADFTTRPATYNNFIVPEGDRNYRFGADSLGRVYFSCGEYLPDSRNRVLWRWENGEVERHHIDL